MRWSINITAPVGCVLTLLVYLCTAEKQQCDHKVWDEPEEGRGVKTLSLSCLQGSVEWHGPFGGVFLTINGPQREYELCLQGFSSFTSAVVSLLSNDMMKPKTVLKLSETKKNGKPVEHTMCFPAQGATDLFIEADLDSAVSSYVKVMYDIEKYPRYGEDACRPCTDEELLYHYCSSQLVAFGRILSVKDTAAATMLQVSLDTVKKQSMKHFTNDLKTSGHVVSQLYSPAQCKMRRGTERFIFMGRMRFGKAQLRCAPTYDEFESLQRTSKQRGQLLCT